jgi:hypothetical protein
MSVTFNNILFTPEKSNKRSHSPNNISCKKTKHEVNFVDIFTSNKIINIKKSNRFININNNFPIINFDNFNDYCENNKISDEEKYFSKNVCFQANILLKSSEYLNLSQIQKESILIASLISNLYVFHNEKNILNYHFDISEDHIKIINELINYITFNSPDKPIESWKLIPKYILISLKIGEHDLYEMCKLYNKLNINDIKNYKKYINLFEYNFTNDYLKNLFLLKKNQFNQFCNSIENSIDSIINADTINQFYNF